MMTTVASLFAKNVTVLEMENNWILVDGHRVHLSWLPEKEEEEE